MKQKKFPVMWVVAIVVGLTLIFVMNATGGRINFAGLFAPKPKPEAQQQVAAASKEETKNVLANQVASLNKSDSDRSQPSPIEPPGQAGGLPEEPAIFIPEMQRFEQTPNDSATSNQWYRDGSYVKDESEEVKKNRTIEDN